MKINNISKFIVAVVIVLCYFNYITVSNATEIKSIVATSNNKVKIKKKFITNNVKQIKGAYVKKGTKWYASCRNGNKLLRMFPESFENNIKTLLTVPVYMRSDYKHMFIVLGKDGRLWVNSEWFSTMNCFMYKKKNIDELDWGINHTDDDNLIDDVTFAYKDIKIESINNKNFKWNLVLVEDDIKKIWIDFLGYNIAFITKDNILYTYGLLEYIFDLENPEDCEHAQDSFPPPNLVKHYGINVSKVKMVTSDIDYLYILMKNGILYRIPPFQKEYAEQGVPGKWWYRKKCKVKRKYIIKKNVKDILCTDLQVRMLLKNGVFGKVNKYGKIKKLQQNVRNIYCFYNDEESTAIISNNIGKKGVYISGTIFKSNYKCVYVKEKNFIQDAKTVMWIDCGYYYALTPKGKLYRIELA